MKKIKRSLAILLTGLLLMSTPITGLAAEAQAQAIAAQGTVSRPAVDQVIDDLEKWERASIQAALQAAADQEVVSPSVYNWSTIGLGRLDRYDGLSDYLAKNEEYLQNNWNSILRKVTDLARISLAVGAAQGNPRDFGGKDLIAEIYNYADLEAQGINGPFFALIALDSGGYEPPSTAKWTRDKIL
ncbi:MAG TPA: cell wall-binding protein, partial [Desulfosporosinus sp.]|nr:cell wall-binding protein [Desulfosporosinus sp.]